MKTKEPQNLTELLTLELSNKKKALFYLNEAIKDNDMDFFLRCIKIVIDQNGGMKAVSEQAKVSRSSLYKTLSGNRSPSIHQIEKILLSIGFGFSIIHQPNKSIQTVA